MKLKSLIIVIATLAALSVIVFFVRRPSAPVSADARLGHSLSEGVNMEKVAKIHLSDQGKSVDLARQADGTWHVTTYYDLPADFNKLSAFTSSLSEAKLQRLVTTNPERIARLEFKDTKIELRDEAGKELWSVTLGKNAESGGGRYVRFGPEQKAYLASFNAWLDAESKNWADSQILNLKPDDIATITVPFEGGSPVVLSRPKKDSSWTTGNIPAGQRINATKVSSLLVSTGSIRFSDTTETTDANAVAAKAHERAFKLTTFDGKTYTVGMGRKPEEKKLKPAVAPASNPAPKAETGTVAQDNSGTKAGPAETKPTAPEYETIPAGPVFVFISSSETSAPINRLMQKRAFQIADYAFTSLPQKPEELFEPAPAPASPAPLAPTSSPVKSAEPKSN